MDTEQEKNQMDNLMNNDNMGVVEPASIAETPEAVGNVMPQDGLTEPVMPMETPEGLPQESAVAPAPIAENMSTFNSLARTVDRNIITIYTTPGYGVNAVNRNGDIIPGSNQKLKNGTRVRATRVYLINGKPAYYIGSEYSGWFVYQAYTDQVNGIQINYVPGYGVNAVDHNGDRSLNSKETFFTDSMWRFYYSEVKRINGSLHYKVGADKYIPSYYTYGGGYAF
ncbi:hypothetical protein [Xylocopilactobacillus apicola]|uniref:Surface layer protein A domain-containing protein n=1 Tax=Xylocopilactobacillus apicola TaxID=2932184 RepID=A0AAU9CXL6_9LACO|nr:hypothetical protein [Xylocopilactobacillus apicola]BDR58739.1 hypothetical protein XA3_11800 [Xylocopilactobacillus apicola]